jgi:DNA repair protein RadC
MKPRERCLLHGSNTLSLKECLTLLIGSGSSTISCTHIADLILDKTIGNGSPEIEKERAFYRSMELNPIAHVQNIHGLGPAGQTKLLAAFEIGRRYTLFSQRLQNHGPVQLSKSSSRVLAKIHPPFRHESREWLGFVPLYQDGQLGELCLVEKGVRTHVNIDPAELFARILALRPLGFYLAHNHPSGNPNPSLHDIDLTQKVKKASEPLGIQMLGHWIVSGPNQYWLD